MLRLWGSETIKLLVDNVKWPPKSFKADVSSSGQVASSTQLIKLKLSRYILYLVYKTLVLKCFALAAGVLLFCPRPCSVLFLVCQDYFPNQTRVIIVERLGKPKKSEIKTIAQSLG